MLHTDLRQRSACLPATYNPYPLLPCFRTENTRQGSKGTRPFGAQGSGDGARHPRETPRGARRRRRARAGGGPGLFRPGRIDRPARLAVDGIDDDFQLIQELCRAHGVSRSDYIRQLARVDAVTGDVGARRVLVLDRTTMLAVAEEMRAWGHHHNQAVHALNVMVKHLRNAWNVDGDEVADQLVHMRSRLDDVERGQEDIAARIDELCCLDAIRGRWAPCP